MKWFRRTRRVDVGTYTDPLPTAQPSLEAQIEDGVLLALSAARLAVTNLLIVRSLRDGKDYDDQRVRAAVTDELLALALEKEHEAKRVSALRGEARVRPGTASSPNDFRARDGRRLERRATVSTGLAARLAELATDPGVVGDIAERAHRAFLDEFEVSVARGAQAFAAPARGELLSEPDRNAELQALADDLDRLGSDARRRVRRAAEE